MAITITNSVSRGGTKGKGDTRKIHRLLNAVFPGAVLAVDGLCGRKTIARVERIQRRFMATPDGRVDPGGRTLRRLNQCAPERQPDWRGDSSRWSQEKKLNSLDSRMRPRLERIIESLRALGFKRKMVYAWRSVAAQQELVAKGHSTVRFSFHNAQKKNGTPNAYAADIIDSRWAWGDSAMDNGFWEALGQAAKQEDLLWDGNWRTFKDWAHVQLHPNRMLAQIRRESGLA